MAGGRTVVFYFEFFFTDSPPASSPGAQYPEKNLFSSLSLHLPPLSPVFFLYLPLFRQNSAPSNGSGKFPVTFFLLLFGVKWGNMVLKVEESGGE